MRRTSRQPAFIRCFVTASCDCQPDCGPASHVASPVAEPAVGIMRTRDAIAAVATVLIVFSFQVGCSTRKRGPRRNFLLSEISKVAASWLPILYYSNSNVELCNWGTREGENT